MSRAAPAERRFRDLPQRPVVKICGLTRSEDVGLARDLGAWALGFVFAPSPRRLTPAAARGLIASARATGPGGPGPLAIGVFGDVSPQEIAEVVAEAGLDGVQLHGVAGPCAHEVRAAVGHRDSPLLVIKAVPVDPATTDRGTEARARLETVIAAARKEADIVLLDTRAGGRFGGSGTPFAWRLARDVGVGTPVLVAGGIGPDNARAALDEAGAWGVDVSSGVENAPGVKDATLMKRLFAQVGSARRPAAGSAVTGVVEGGAAAVAVASAAGAAATDRLDTHEPQEGPDR